jgi:hypothetical protein
MSQDERAIYEKTIKMLKPALERVASDPAFRERLELNPLQVLDEMKVEIDDLLRAELAGRRFSEFWEAHRKAAEGPVEVRDLPPQDGELQDKDLEAVSGGVLLGSGPIASFAPPYVPVGPAGTADFRITRSPLTPKLGDFEK